MTKQRLSELGGEAVIEAAVVRFYGKVMNDPSLASFFEGFDMDRQVKKQIAFMRAVLSDDETAGLGAAHARARARGLSDEHFDNFARLLAETLVELEIDEETRSRIAGHMEEQRNHVLDR